ncbi:MAG: DJ-1/PfpI family protein [Proteobacteria bacterium]|nr:DJ-1/PfpI family protein [Pseudomonadota bacterium]
MNFGFLLFPDVEELDFVGPWEIIGMWSKMFDGPEQCLIVSQEGQAVRCAKGLQVKADHSFETCPPLDYLLVPGGQGTRREVDNAELISFVQKQAAGCRQVLSVCTGSFVLQAAGLLQGKRATTYWRSLDLLGKLPGVSVVEERFARDGDIWTAAGVSAGIDLALALIADQAGPETAGKVQLAVEYYPSTKRYGQAHLSPQAPGYLKESK